jgi:hypothetical protein
MLSPEEPDGPNLTGLSPALDRYANENHFSQAGDVMAGAAEDLAGQYETDRRPAATTRWQEWSARVIEPLWQSSARSGKPIRFPVEFLHGGLMLAAAVSFEFGGDFEELEQARVLANMASDLDDVPRIWLEKNHWKTDEKAELAKVVGAMVGQDKFKRPEAGWFSRSRQRHYVEPAEIKAKAQQMFETALGKTALNESVGYVRFSVEEKAAGRRLAQGIVDNPAYDFNGNGYMLGHGLEQDRVFGEVKRRLNPYIQFVRDFQHVLEYGRNDKHDYVKMVGALDEACLRGEARQTLAVQIIKNRVESSLPDTPGYINDKLAEQVLKLLPTPLDSVPGQDRPAHTG